MLRSLCWPDALYWFYVSDDKLRIQTWSQLMDLQTTPNLRVFWKCLPGWQTMVGTQPGRRLPNWQPLRPTSVPHPPAPPSVSDAAWPVHTSCLCGPGMSRIQTAALLPLSAAQQGALTPHSLLSHCLTPSSRPTPGSWWFYSPLVSGLGVWVAVCGWMLCFSLELWHLLSGSQLCVVAALVRFHSS